MTPAAPFEAMIMKIRRPICSGIDMGAPMAVAMNSDAIVR